MTQLRQLPAVKRQLAAELASLQSLHHSVMASMLRVRELEQEMARFNDQREGYAPTRRVGNGYEYPIRAGGSYSGMAGSEQRLQGVAAAVDGAENAGSDWLWSQLAEQVEVAAEADTETLAPEGSADGVRLPALTTPPEAESEKAA